MLKKILAELAQNKTQLVVVSKMKTSEQILKMYQQGQRIFGENRVQELVAKYEVLPKDIEWHQIGHLQTNKVKYIAPFVTLIQAVDSLKLLQEIDKQAKKRGRIIPCLLQFWIAEESTKFGLELEEAKEILASDAFYKLENIRIDGVMGMATFTECSQQIRREFQNLKIIFDTLKNNYFKEKKHFKEISMGMSGDYKIAMEEGSTMVRIGSLIFNHQS